VTRALRLALPLWLIVAALPRPAAAANFADLAFRPHPGARLPLGSTLTDEQGRQVLLGRYFTGKPVVLVLEYLRCKTFCGMTLKNLFAALDTLPLAPRRDFEIVAVSIDPRDTPAEAGAAKAKYLSAFGHHPDAAAGIHFLTGRGATTSAIAEIVGFPYRYDPVLDQYLHPAGFVVAAPDGNVSHYVLGVAPTPAELRRDLSDAAAGEAVSPLTRLFLLCHIEGAPLGRWTVPVLAAFTVANVAAGLTLAAVFGAIRRRRHG